MEEDIKIIKNHYLFTTNHVLDDENKRLKQAIENLINKYKEAYNKGYSDRDKQAQKICEECNYIKKCKEQEKMIKLMARFIKINTSDDGLSIRPATIEEKIEFFRKKAKGE